MSNRTIRKINTEEIRLRKNAKKGARLRIMVLGSKGCGKSTFLNSLCGKNIFPTEKQQELTQDAAHAHISPTVNVLEETVVVNENNETPIYLDIVLFPGAGDNLDDRKTPRKIKEYLEEQFEKVLSEELQIKRTTKTIDPRPHVCIYFLKTTKWGIRAFDLNMMAEIQEHVNIIPVISKVDTLTEFEYNFVHSSVNKSLVLNKIKVYDFKNESLKEAVMSGDYLETSEEISDMLEQKSLNDLLPFGMSCSNESFETPDGEIQHVLNFQWGKLVIENMFMSGFLILKAVLLGSHLQELKYYTKNYLYEAYRTQKLLARNNNCEISNNIQNPDDSEKLLESHKSFLSGKFSELTVQNYLHNKNESPNNFIANNELEEKNKIIEAYQKKISELEVQIQARRLESNKFELSTT